MNHVHFSAHRSLSLLFALFAVPTGCVDSVEVFPDATTADAGSTPPGEDSSAGPTDAGRPMDAFVGMDAGSEPDDAFVGTDAGTCTLRPSGIALSTCKRAYQMCAISGLALSEATFVGCSDQAGIGGNPALVVATCEAAIQGESGQTCGANFHECTGPATDTCCVRHAECSLVGNGLALAEICVPHCEQTPLLPGPTVHNCDELLAVDALPETTGSNSKFPNLVGLPCVGQFECGPDSSFGFSLFCGAGRLQILTLGPNGLGSFAQP